MISKKVWWILRKDLKESLGNKMVVLPMIILPLILCVALPILLIVVGLSEGVSAMNGAESIEKVLPLYHIPARFAAPIERLLYVFLNYLLIPFFIIIPIMVSSVIAAHSVAGEKERHSLETLLYTPVTNREFVLGKLLSAFVPSMALSLASFILYFAVCNLTWYALRGTIVVDSPAWIPALAILTPAVSLFALGCSLFASIKAKSYIEAQQSAALVVLPCVGLMAAQLGGLVVASPLAIAAAGLVLLAIDYLLVSRVAPRFDRERLLSCL